eukprot:9481006-Prorocentrum_lima.AAC.1
MGPSWTISMGTFTGGLLWMEHEKGSTAPPFEAKGMDPCVKGTSVCNQRKVVSVRWNQVAWSNT